MGAGRGGRGGGGSKGRGRGKRQGRAGGKGRRIWGKEEGGVGKKEKEEGGGTKWEREELILTIKNNYIQRKSDKYMQEHTRAGG